MQGLCVTLWWAALGTPTGLWDYLVLLQKVCSGAPAHGMVCPPWIYRLWNPSVTSLDQPSWITQGCTSAWGENWQAPHSHRPADPGFRVLLCLGKFAQSSHQQLPLTWPNTNWALLVHICALGEPGPLLDRERNFCPVEPGLMEINRQGNRMKQNFSQNQKKCGQTTMPWNAK